MKQQTKQLQKGFTLVETLVAILILTMTVGALLSLAAGGFFSVRYARNQIVGDNLLQEALEYIRNNRDTSFAQGMTWTDWLATLNVDEDGKGMGYGSQTGCFSEAGCIIDPYTSDAKIRACPDTCETILFYPDVGFYGYNSTYPDPIGGQEAIETSFVRTITAVESENDPEQIIVTAKIQWLNGTNPKTVTQSMVLTNWVP